MYFGFGDVGNYPSWPRGLLTSLDEKKIPDQYYQYDYKNPFTPRLRRLLKKYEKNINLGLTHHTIFVEQGKGIKPIIHDITRILIANGWVLGEFNRSMSVDDMWEEYQNGFANKI